MIKSCEEILWERLSESSKTTIRVGITNFEIDKFYLNLNFESCDQAHLARKFLELKGFGARLIANPNSDSIVANTHVAVKLV